MRFKQHTRTNWRDNTSAGEGISLPNGTRGRAVACGERISALNDTPGRAVYCTTPLCS